jgi:septal ring factor EnvC (AmiA/AmiB activator)
MGMGAWALGQLMDVKVWIIIGLSVVCLFLGASNHHKDSQVAALQVDVERHATAVAQAEFDKANLQTKINLVEADRDRLENGVAALQKQVKGLQADNSKWQKRAREKESVIKGLQETAARAMIESGQVIDAASSVRVVGEINEIFSM